MSTAKLVRWVQLQLKVVLSTMTIVQPSMIQLTVSKSQDTQRAVRGLVCMKGMYKIKLACKVYTYSWLESSVASLKMVTEIPLIISVILNKIISLYTVVLSGRDSRPSVMTTGGSRPLKSIPGPTVAATIGVPTDLDTFSLIISDEVTGRRAGSP